MPSVASVAACAVLATAACTVSAAAPPALPPQRTSASPKTTNSIGWWWSAPETPADDPGVQGLVDFCTENHDVVGTVIMNCGITTCQKSPDLPRTNCTNNGGVGGTVVGNMSAGCAAAIPKLQALGIRVELWLGEDDSIDSARYLFAHPDETAAALLAVAREHPAISGFNLDLETDADVPDAVPLFAEFLTTVTRALHGNTTVVASADGDGSNDTQYDSHSANGTVAVAGRVVQHQQQTGDMGPLRFSVDVSCESGTAAGGGRLDTACEALAASEVDRMMNMGTYNAASFIAWYYQRFDPLLKLGAAARPKLAVGLGCWIDSRVNSTSPEAWSVTPKSAEQRVCAIMNHSFTEIDMFDIRQGQADPQDNFPEAFWLPQLRKFMAGGGCPQDAPPVPVCPNATVGPVDSWQPGGDVNCCEASARRGPDLECNITCAQAECAAAPGMWWKPENYSAHPFECCTGNKTRTLPY